MELVEALEAGLAAERQRAWQQRARAMQDLVGAGDGSWNALADVLECLEQAGLGGAVRSWRGAGPLVRIVPAQLHAALGREAVQRLAARAGLTCDELTAELSEHLPAIVARTARDPGRHRHEGRRLV